MPNAKVNVAELKGRRLGRVLTKMGKVTREQVHEALAIQQQQRRLSLDAVEPEDGDVRASRRAFESRSRGSRRPRARVARDLEKQVPPVGRRRACALQGSPRGRREGVGPGQVSEAQGSRQADSVCSGGKYFVL